GGRCGRLFRDGLAAGEHRAAAGGADQGRTGRRTAGAPHPDRSGDPRALPRDAGGYVIVTDRLTPQVFRLPIEKIRAGYKSDIYFARTKLILERDARHDRVTMQIFQKHPDAVIVGTDQTLAILHVGAGRYRDRALAQTLFERYLAAEKRLYAAWLALPQLDWSRYEPVAREVFEISRELASLWEPAWHELEVTSLYDGESATPFEPVMHIEGEYAAFAHLATLKLDEFINRSSDASGHLTAKGTAEGHVNLTSLVDFQNDVVNTSLGVAHALGARLWGVRIDTSETLIDRSILRELEESGGEA